MSAAAWVMEALVASTLLMVLVLLVRRPVRRAFGADVAYALWALPALRLVLPPLPASWHAAAVAPVLRATERVTILFVEPAAAPAAEPSQWSALPTQAIPALAVLWAVGAAAFALWHALAHRRFCRRMLADATAGDTIDGVRVIESAAASGPLAFGIRRRYVAFPQDAAERYDAEERELALRHELGHHARGDLAANWVALAVLALHWFNPVAWRAFRAFRADQEIANDARVLAGLSPMRRHAYACAIVKTAHPASFAPSFGRAVSTACHLHTIDDLKGRLRMLTTKRVSRVRRMGGMLALTVLTAGGLALTASGTAAAAAARDTVERATGVDLATDQAPPTPPQQASPQVAPIPPAPPIYIEPPVSTPKGVSPVAVGKRRYKLVVTEDGRTVSEHELSGPPLPPPGVAGAGVRRVITLDRDGKITSDDVASATPPSASRVLMFRRFVAGGPGVLPPMPAISAMNCSDAVKSEALRVDGKGKRRILLCTDRIERAAAMAANGKDIERDAYVRALGGLRDARARMTNAPDMSADQRKGALDGIDTAIRELESDLAKTK